MRGDAFFDAIALTPRSGTATTQYDAATHTFAVRTTSASGVSVGGATDSRGRSVETSIQPSGEQTLTLSSRSYDDLDRLVRSETAPGEGLGIAASFTYTPAGRLESVTGPRDATTTLAYDAAGRLTGTTSPLGVRSRLRYDALGRLSESFWPTRGSEPTSVASRISYDSLGRTSSTDVFSEDGALYARTASEYDIASRLTRVAVSGLVTGTIDTAYDDLDRVTQSVSSGVALTATSTVTYEPDSSLPVTQTLFAMGSSRTLKHEWTKTGELFSTTHAGQQWRMSFGVGGALTTLVGPNTVATRSYNVTGALEAVRLGLLDGQVSAPLASSVLAYDSRGRIGQHAVAWSGSTGATDTFAYDRADRLRSWTRTGAGATSATYGYDPSGNLTTATVGAATTAFSYDIGDQLTRAVTGSAVTTYTNDSLGRRTAAIAATGTTTYAWDPLSRLTQVVSPDATATYAYGPTGMREQKTLETPSGTTWTKTAWAGSELALELDSDGTSYTYLWGPGRIPLSVTEKTAAGVSATYAYQVDAMGSVIGMTDASGAVVARYAYDPWGNPISATGTAAIATRNPLRYRAYYTDAETGLIYMPARYYDPATARFLSPDPAPPSAGEPGSLNAFAYCLGDPVNLTDSSGATVDVIGDGKLGVEDSVQQKATCSGNPVDQAAANAAVKAAASDGSAAAIRAAAIAARIAFETSGMTGTELVQYYFGPFGDVKYADLSRLEWPEYASYTDVNFTVFMGAGFTVGLITNRNKYMDGHMVREEHLYAGIGLGGPGGPGGSWTTGKGRTDRGGYLEAALGAVVGGAVGWKLGRGFAESQYRQGGISTPGASLCVFIVR